MLKKSNLKNALADVGSKHQDDCPMSGVYWEAKGQWVIIWFHVMLQLQSLIIVLLFIAIVINTMFYLVQRSQCDFLHVGLS